MDKFELINADCLDVLKAWNGKLIDLVYIDPPFNSGRDYGEFNDKWSQAKEDMDEFSSIAPDFVAAMALLKVKDSMLNYLAAVGLRCFYIHKVLKPTGSFYLHCDDAAGSYVKVLLDYIFGVKNFRNVITWRRNYGGKTLKSNYARNSDSIFYYTKTANYTFHVQYKGHKEATSKNYKHKDYLGRIYCLDNTLAKTTTKEWIIDGKVIRHPKGKSFAWSQETLDRKRKEHFEKYGTELIVFTKNGIPQQVRYLEDAKGAVVDNVWTEINCLSSQAKERLGYPTQKPEALLERIILASSNPGDLVADFFMGSGTTGAAALKLERRFIGCDVNPEAVRLARERLGGG
jgi:DNA modification methylase